MYSAVSNFRLAGQILLKLSGIINGIINNCCFAHKFSNNCYRNLILAQDLHFITQSKIYKIWIENYLQKDSYLLETVNIWFWGHKKGFFFSKKMFYVFLLTQFFILWQKKNPRNDFFSNCYQQVCKHLEVWISFRFTLDYYDYSSFRSYEI